MTCLRLGVSCVGCDIPNSVERAMANDAGGRGMALKPPVLYYSCSISVPVFVQSLFALDSQGA